MTQVKKVNAIQPVIVAGIENGQMSSSADAQLINVSKSNPEQGWILMSQTRTVPTERGEMTTTVTGFKRGSIASLEAFVASLDLQVGDAIEGKLLVVETTTPVIADSTDFGLKLCRDQKTAYEHLDTNTGDVLPIYITREYVTDESRADIFLPHVNVEEVRAANAKVNLNKKVEDTKKSLRNPKVVR